MNKIVLRDRMYIPIHLIDERAAEKRYTHTFYDDKVCNRCENRPERHNYICDTCEAYQGTNKVANEVVVGDTHYIGVPMGDRYNTDRIGVDPTEFEIVDKRCKQKFRLPVKMVKGFELRDYQLKPFSRLIKKKYGIFEAPPRSGKTPTMLCTGVELGYRVIMIADQKEFLQQFLDHVQEFTNLPKLEKKLGKKLFGFIKKPEDTKNFEIAVVTYQSLLSEKGQKMLKLINKRYGTVLIDEVHSSGALEYSRVLNKLAQRVRIGCTGTVTRKDGRHKITRQIVGPVTAKAKISQLKASVYVHVLDYVKSKSAYRGKAGFSYCVNFLSNHKKRNEEILEWIGKDLAKGHSIVVAMMRKEHILEMTKRVNDLYGANTAGYIIGGASNKSAQALREQTIDKAKAGKLRVIFGTRSLLQRGLNVVPWSMLYNVMPINNPSNWKQESSRILTPDPDGKKRDPAIRLFVDSNIGLSLGCFVPTYKQCLALGHKPTDTARERASKMMALKGGDTREGEFNFDSL